MNPSPNQLREQNYSMLSIPASEQAHGMNRALLHEAPGWSTVFITDPPWRRRWLRAIGVITTRDEREELKLRFLHSRQIVLGRGVKLIGSILTTGLLSQCALCSSSSVEADVLNPSWRAAR